MKKIYCLLLVAFFWECQNLYAQLPSAYSEPQHKISFDIFTAIIGRTPLTSELGLIYTRNLKPRIDVNLKLAYSGPNVFLFNLESDNGTRFRDDIGIKGVAVGSMLQYLLNPDGRRRWYTGVELNYTFTHLNDKQDRSLKANLTKFSTALLIGYRVDRFAGDVELDIFVGFGIGFRNYRWERNEIRSANNNNPGQIVNGTWSVGWGMKLEPSISYAIPIGIRAGHWFKKKSFNGHSQLENRRVI